MPTVILLDAGPLGLVCGPPLSVAAREAREARSKLGHLEGAGFTVMVADVTVYEVRRELTRRGARVQLALLDEVADRLGRIPVDSSAWDRAAEFWAQVRRVGLPTAGADALDGDAVLAGLASTLGGPDLGIVIATTNLRHLGRFPGVDARDWSTIGT